MDAELRFGLQSPRDYISLMQEKNFKLQYIQNETKEHFFLQYVMEGTQTLLYSTSPPT